VYKHAIVTPVPKIHQPKDINNDFRKISVHPHLAKTIQKIQLELNSHDLAIKDDQHAFAIEIERVNSFKLLGVWVQNDLKWNTSYHPRLVY
jgi:hypothetical protein